MQKSKTPTILITGATGNIGTELTKLLSTQKAPFRAMVRSIKEADRLAAWEGAELIAGDFNDGVRYYMTGIIPARCVLYCG